MKLLFPTHRPQDVGEQFFRGTFTFHTGSMTTLLPVSKQGTITLPNSLIEKFDLNQTEHPFVILEERGSELILRPASILAGRDLPASLIAEWIAEDEATLSRFYS